MTSVIIADPVDRTGCRRCSGDSGGTGQPGTAAPRSKQEGTDQAEKRRKTDPLMVPPPPGGPRQRRVQQALQAIALPRKMVGTTTRAVGECSSRVSRSAPDTQAKSS